MKIKITDINGITLKTQDKLCPEDIKVVVDRTNLKPENIKSGVTILGVTGTHG
jgi:hypothetical protein